MAVLWVQDTVVRDRRELMPAVIGRDHVGGGSANVARAGGSAPVRVGSEVEF